MSFLNLAAFGLLGLGPVILFFYLLKLRRRPVEVSSTLFWSRAVEDLTANAPFQKLRRNLLLYLQLLILLLMILALARPLMNLKARSGRSTIVLLDVSASMQTREGNATRFDQGIEQLKTMIDDMDEGDSMMIVAFADSAKIAASFTRDKVRLRQSLSSIEPTHDLSNLNEAFLLAHSLARQRSDAEIVIISDGAVPEGEYLSQLEGVIPVRFIKTGLATENAGFTRVDLRRAPESERDFQLFAEVSNFSPLARTFSLEVMNNGTLSQSREVRVEANSSASELFEIFFKEGQIALSLNTDNDAFPLDDVSFLTLRKPPQTKVLLVSPGNYFLEKAIRFDRDLNAELTIVDIGSYPPENVKDYDVTVFDTVEPTELAPGNYLFIGALPPGLGFERAGEIAAPPIVDWDAQHPVMRYVELADVAVSRALDVALPASSLTLASTVDEKPLIALLGSDRRNVVLYTFDLFDSNLPLRMAFPLLISNTLNFLSHGKSASQAAFVRTGDTVELFVPVDAKDLAVVDPDGKRHPIDRGKSGTAAAFDQSDRVGFYEVWYNGEAQQTFGVNLLSDQESRIEPKSVIELGKDRKAVASKLDRVNTEVWPWFALGGLAILLLEWLAFHRRFGV